MTTLKFLFVPNHDGHLPLHMERLAALPLLHRLRDPRARKHLLASAIGAAVVMAGSYVAHLQQDLVPHWAWEGFGYSIHAAGLGPILAHIEPVWRVFLD